VVKGITAQVDKERCVGCGKCAKECPASVITIEEATA
jgi:ferredoxin